MLFSIPMVFQIKTTFLACLLITASLFASTQSSAQSPLDLLTQEATETQDYQAPDVNKLPSQWWQLATDAAPQGQPYLHLMNWSEDLFQQLQIDPQQFSIDETQAINQFRTNLIELSKREKLEDFIHTPEFQDPKPYTMSGIFDRMKALRHLNQLLEEHQDTEQEFIADAQRQRSHIDQLVIQYGGLAVNDPERRQLGLMWMAYRSWVALNQQQADTQNQLARNTTEQMSVLNKHIDSMKAQLLPNAASLDALERQIGINQSALKKSRQKVLNASQTLAKSEKTDDDSGVHLDINKLSLTQNIMSQKRLELAIARDTTHMTWINLDLQEKPLATEDQKIILENNQKLIQDTATEIEQWRKLGQEVLLAPTAIANQSDTAKKAVEQRTQTAQQLLLSIEPLSWEVDKLLFLNGLLTEHNATPESGVLLWWSQLKSLGLGIITSIDQTVNRPLFRINETPVTLRPLLQLMFIIVLAYLIAKLARMVFSRLESKRDADHAPMIFMLNKLSHYLIVIIAVLLSFSTLGINLSKLTLIAGALSVGIGFGLQNIVSNFVSGLTIMFERSLKVGDYIELENGITGSVKEINARSTRINTNDNIDVVIPNSDLVTNQIINWTLRDSIKRVKIPFGVAYGTDKELVKKAAQEAAEKVPFTLTNMKGKEPEVWMTGFGDNSLDFILLVWVSKYGVRRPNRIKASFLWELDSTFIKYNIEVPFPQRVLHKAKDTTSEFHEDEE